ncbi:hypothetical protein LJA00_08515 [Campylobacter jejuni]
MPNVLERKRRGMNPPNRPEVKLTIQNGPFIIHNVPHILRSQPGPDGDLHQLKLSVAYRIAAICEYMTEKEINVFNYDLYTSYPEITNKLLH